MELVKKILMRTILTWIIRAQLEPHVCNYNNYVHHKSILYL